MRVFFERSHWRDAVALSLALRWQDWHLGHIDLELTFLVWVWTLTIVLKRR